MADFNIPPFHNYQPSFNDPLPDKVGGNSNLNSKMEGYIEELRSLMDDFPDDKKQVSKLLEKIQHFLSKNYQELEDECKSNGWNTSIPCNYDAELKTAMSDIQTYQKALSTGNLNVAKSCMEQLNESMTQVQFFLSNQAGN